MFYPIILQIEYPCISICILVYFLFYPEVLSCLIIPYCYPHVSIKIQTVYPVILSYHIHIDIQKA
jgi:hypothetical protein